MSNDDISTRAGFFARARKAWVAAVGAFAASIGPAAVLVTADGSVTWEEALPVLVIAAGLAFGAGALVYRVPNEN